MAARSGRVGVVAAMVVAALLPFAAVATRGDAASIMIWPLNPVLESHQRATAIWIENRGLAPVTLQIRVLRWDVHQYADRYIEQHDDVVGSPPLATIEPGQRQLVRLLRMRQPPAGTEAAYRVLIDELPRPSSAHDGTGSSQASLGVTFRMRYSLPFFVYGEGLSPVERRPSTGPVVPHDTGLSWRIVADDRGRWLQISNSGPRHARLTEVRLETPDATFDVARGLLGYVLSGKDVRWPLPPSIPGDSPAIGLDARVNGQSAAILARH